MDCKSLVKEKLILVLILSRLFGGHWRLSFNKGNCNVVVTGPTDHGYT